MYTLGEIEHIIATKDKAKRATRAKYAIKRIQETIRTYQRLKITWPALYDSMRNDMARLQNVI